MTPGAVDHDEVARPQLGREGLQGGRVGVRKEQRCASVEVERDVLACADDLTSLEPEARDAGGPEGVMTLAVMLHDRDRRAVVHERDRVAEAERGGLVTSVAVLSLAHGREDARLFPASPARRAVGSAP